MPRIKRIVCLANSRKLSGRCIAGKEFFPGGWPGAWIRPVSAREHEEVSERERQYEDGSDPRVLDVIRVQLLQAKPKSYQQENWLLDPGPSWKKVGGIAPGGLAALTDPVEPLWLNGHKTYNGLNDRIPLDLAGTITSSLRFIQVDSLVLRVFKPGEAFGDAKRRVQGRFAHAGDEYRLWVTDPVYERAYLAKPDGAYELDACFLTISLGEPHEGFCYKLIAAIIARGAGAGA